MKKLKAIIFDLDGTLVDSDHYHFNCWNEILSEFNINLEYDYYLNHFAGRPTSLNADTLIKKYALSITSKDLSAQKDTITKSKIKTEKIKFMPNALSTLKYFANENIPMFLVTGSPRAEVDYVLKKTDIKKYFEFTITRNDVKKSKPDPEPYLKAIEKCNFNIENILVFEDTKNGVESAKSANLRCYAIQANTDLQKKLKHADKIFESFDQAIKYLEKENFR
ncbi:HAD family phosphatase [Flavobacterium sp. UMI-01]|uniref:HAD family hydrolase n=1 Tax=Flavobacterium sp. UMI-01 TaxID=1441053 RepID=UPI001C7D12A5|nr:HAD family phosphatase [Flavobacterium sp. UMI-01]GIZ09382.1 phosphorylated carbohydrates phosphatase [Flavobacterium sp. UMI-01]